MKDSTAALAWVGSAGSQIFLMQVGFLCYEVGFVHPVWTASIIIKNIEDTFVGVITCMVFSYSFALSEEAWFGGFIGSPKHILLLNTTPSDHSTVFILGCYAVTCATISSGAVLERLKNKGYIMWTCLIVGCIYPLLAFWCWNPASWLHSLGFHDCAGALVVHSTGGMAGVVAVYYLGPQRDAWDNIEGKLRSPEPAYRPVMVALGVFLLWYGWYAFNISSPMISGHAPIKTGTIALVTTMAPTSSAMTCFLIMRYRLMRISFEDLCGCVLAGLVAETACCYTCHFWSSLVIGAGATVVYYGGNHFIRYMLIIDDPLSIGAIHIFPSIFGIIMEGVFCDGTYDGNPGLIYGHWRHFCCQILGCVACITVNWVLCVLLWKFMINVMWGDKDLRVTALDTFLGTRLYDLTPEPAFTELLSAKSNISRQVLLRFHQFCSLRNCAAEFDFVLAITFLRKISVKHNVDVGMGGRRQRNLGMVKKVIEGIHFICETYIEPHSRCAVKVSRFARSRPIRVRDGAWSDSHRHLRLTLSDRSVFDAAYSEVFKMLMEPLRRFFSTFDKGSLCVNYEVGMPFKLSKRWELIWNDNHIRPSKKISATTIEWASAEAEETLTIERRKFETEQRRILEKTKPIRLKLHRNTRIIGRHALPPLSESHSADLSFRHSVSASTPLTHNSTPDLIPILSNTSDSGDGSAPTQYFYRQYPPRYQRYKVMSGHTTPISAVPRTPSMASTPTDSAAAITPVVDTTSLMQMQSSAAATPSPICRPVSYPYLRPSASITPPPQHLHLCQINTNSSVSEPINGDTSLIIDDQTSAEKKPLLINHSTTPHNDNGNDSPITPDIVSISSSDSSLATSADKEHDLLSPPHCQAPSYRDDKTDLGTAEEKCSGDRRAMVPVIVALRSESDNSNEYLEFADDRYCYHEKVPSLRDNTDGTLAIVVVNP